MGVARRSELKTMLKKQTGIKSHTSSKTEYLRELNERGGGVAWGRYVTIEATKSRLPTHPIMDQ